MDLETLLLKNKMSALRNNDCKYISNKEIKIIFDGKTYPAYEGDTIASALLRNNIRLIGRSFKYHRPRGIYTCGIEEPNGLVQILNEHNEPNTRATVKKVYDGIQISSQNRWPSILAANLYTIIYLFNCCSCIGFIVFI